MLTRTAGQGIALQHLVQQGRTQAGLPLGAQTSQIGLIGSTPSAAGPGRLTPPPWIAAKTLFKTLQRLLQRRGRGAAWAIGLTAGPRKGTTHHLAMHLMQALQRQPKPLGIGGEGQAEPLNLEPLTAIPLG